MTEKDFFKQVEQCTDIASLVQLVEKHPKLRQCLQKWNGIVVKGTQAVTMLTKNHRCSVEMLKENILEDADNLTNPIHYGDSVDPMSGEHRSEE